MRSKNDMKNELITLKKELARLKTKETEIENLMSSRESSEKMSSNLLTLIKFMMEENKNTRTLMQHMFEKMAKLEDELGTEYIEEQQPVQSAPGSREVPVSDLDRKIIQFIQLKEMACADDVKKHMSYKGRNAASARLNRLYRQGVIERYQLGHKVFYKYNAGKTTNNILIVSPPQ